MVTSKLEELAVDHDLVPAAAKAAHLAATYLLQLMVLRFGAGPWIEQARDSLREHLDYQRPPEGHPEWVRALWHGTEAAMLENIFRHAELVRDGADRRH